MQSLVCIEHPNWDETLVAIQKEGGKSGHGKFLNLNNDYNAQFKRLAF